MATKTVEHTVDLAVTLEAEVLTTIDTNWIGINRIIALLEELSVNYSVEELDLALNKLLHEKKIEFAMGQSGLNDLMADEKKESLKVSLYFRRVATSDSDG